MELFNKKFISQIYKLSNKKIIQFRKRSNRPLTLTEKILVGHAVNIGDITENNRRYVFFKPDRLALQDVTGQMTILQFMQTRLKTVAIPTAVHCDHLIPARTDRVNDTHNAIQQNNEIFRFLESACNKYKLDFWKPGSGIIHQIILENYAFPGGLMIGTDSHTPNAGGLGMVAVGVGGIDAAETMAGSPWQLQYPKRIGVHLTGKLNGWVSAKDIILYITNKLTVFGGTNHIIEYFGTGTNSISCTGKATITNMGAETGATCSIFPYDTQMEIYLRSTSRNDIADIANNNKNLLIADPEIENNPIQYFDKIIEIDLSRLEPYISGPHTPDLAHTISNFYKDIKKYKYIDKISAALIGSCTNSSYEDMSKVADLAKQAKLKGIKTKIPLFITPGSEQIRATIENEGYLNLLQSIGATVLANACGPCIGQWDRQIENEKNTIVTSFNRNFPGRNDGKRETMNFIASPEMIVALSLSGNLSFNPLTDHLSIYDGSKFKLRPPKKSSIPVDGFKNTNDVYVSKPKNKNIEIIINKNSNRLQKIVPFKAWDKKDYKNLIVLAKVKGKCTTDHISPAGQWLIYRGHLDKLSDNLLLGAVNSYNSKIGKGLDIINNKIEFFSQIARNYKSKKLKWIIVAENNYGEGSSREHAAMTPRYLGCVAVIAKSFARIHENNLKKQGILALRFRNSNDYHKISENDRLNIVGLNKLEPKKPVSCYITNKNKIEHVLLVHSYDELQLNWFYAGSSLNIIN